MTSLVDRAYAVVRFIAVIVGCVAITVLALPSPVKTAPWRPPRAPNLEGAFQPNERLLNAERLASGQVAGPEDLTIDDVGRIYTGTVDGKIVRVTPGLPAEVFTETGGRPFGLRFAPSGDLIVADVVKGLLRVDPTGAIEVLAHDAEGDAFGFLNSVAVARDGTIYLADSSMVWGYTQYIYDILEQRPSGRVIRYDPSTRTSTVLLRNLAFANGIALADDDSFLIVAETARYRLLKLWLSGDNKNLAEPLLENLPGFPDNIQRTSHNTFWVGTFSIRKPLLDLVHPYPFLKDTLAALPESVRPGPIPYGLAFEIDGAGRVLQSLQDPTGRRLRDTSSACEHNGALFVGSLTGTSIGRASL